MPGYASRHRVTVGVGITLGVVALVVLAMWLVSRTDQASRFAREREQMTRKLERLEKERSRAERVAQLAMAIFRLDDPLGESGGRITARQILDQSSYDANVNLAKDPDTQTQVLYLVAGAYLNLGLMNSANRSAQTALDTRAKVFGPDDPRTLESTAQLGWILAHQGQGAQAQRIERDALGRETRLLGADSDQTLQTMRQLAIIDGMLGDHAEEQRLLRQIADIRGQRRDPNAPRR